MRHVLVMLAALSALGVATATSAGATERARLSIVSETPFAVRGTSFQPRERVLVVAYVEGRRAKRVVANTRGVFVARFLQASKEPCTGLFVRATGNMGSRASLKLFPLCPPLLQP